MTKKQFDHLFEQIGDAEGLVPALGAPVTQDYSLPTKRQQALVNQLLEVSRNVKKPRELKEVAEHLGELLRRGLSSWRERIADRLLEIMGEEAAIQLEGLPAIQAMWEVHESLELLYVRTWEAFADRVLTMAQDLGPPRYGRAVLEMLGGLLRPGPPSRRDAILEFLFEHTAIGILDHRCLALDTLASVAGSLTPERFDALGDRAMEMAQDLEPQIREAGLSALERLSSPGPERELGTDTEGRWSFDTWTKNLIELFQEETPHFMGFWIRVKKEYPGFLVTLEGNGDEPITTSPVEALRTKVEDFACTQAAKYTIP